MILSDGLFPLKTLRIESRMQVVLPLPVGAPKKILSFEL
jgi:hypothetical protein